MTMNSLPPVSCICLTYGRPHLLEEAIASFLQQDYAGEKELIVLNDYEQQTLSFAHPEVRVINLPKRVRTVGEKMNMAVALAAHDLLFVWDDDDIYLPHRLTFSVQQFDPEKGFFKPEKAWLWNNGVLSGPVGNFFHVGSCWSRRLFDAVRGYPPEGSGYDQVFETRLGKAFPGALKVYDIKPEEIYYIYRWGGIGSYHMSTFGAYRPNANIGQQEVEAYVRKRADQGQIRHGLIELQPAWKSDYSALVADCMQSLSRNQASLTQEVTM
jgi:glycosyltransferase involved in cell wall biosynthesis